MHNSLFNKILHEYYFPLPVFKDFVSYSFEDFLNNSNNQLNEHAVHGTNAQEMLYYMYYRQLYEQNQDYFISNRKFYTHDTYRQYLTEALVSHDIKSFTKKLGQYLDDANITVTNDAIQIIMRSNEYDYVIRTICRIYGYYVVRTESDEDFGIYVYDIEPTYGYTKMNDKVYNQCGGILYHITEPKFVNKILRVGLIPKHLDKKVSHPGRIYLSVPTDMDKVITLAKELHPSGNYVILTVDLNKLVHKYRPDFYIDPAYAKYGVFTVENIPPMCISVYEQT